MAAIWLGSPWVVTTRPLARPDLAANSRFAWTIARRVRIPGSDRPASIAMSTPQPGCSRDIASRIRLARGKAEDIDTQTLRTVIRTTAPIFRSLVRIVLH